MTLKDIGIDLAKNMFQLHGVDADGECVLAKRVRRDSLLPLLQSCLHPGLGLKHALAHSIGSVSLKDSGTRSRLLRPNM